jgi:cellobiose-specific phosphotransferase system component IIC
MVGISFLIYYPFFKKADADALKEENSVAVNA